MKGREITMEFFDEAITKAKDVLDVACKKTGDIVTVGKQKFDIASVEGKMLKDYQKLGKIYFDKIKDTEIGDNYVKNLVEKIKEESAKIEELKKEIDSRKNKKICSKCGSVVDKLSVYCNICGERLV